MKQFALIISLIIFSFESSGQKKIRYDLFVNDTIVNYSGKKKKAIAINGQIPAPALYFTQGDTAEIYVHNLMDVETSIHWHGIILPNVQDGVPYLTTAPIKPHSTHLYYFPVIQNGTYWYHSHTKLQEQSGMYGALIFYKKNEKPANEYPIVFSDWTDEKPEEVLRSLKMANDWYAIKKHATQNWGEALLKGHFGTKAEQEWKRMFPMDVSDVYYEAFLANGKQEQVLKQYKAGDKIKLRVVNGSASTYFWLQFAGGKLEVVANDGNDVEPVEVDRLIIGVAETYDVVVTVPENMGYEFKATAEDRTKSASVWLGDGMKMPAPVLPQLKYFEGMKMMNSMMNFDGSMDDMGMEMSNQEMDMNNVMYPEITGEEKKKKNKADKKENVHNGHEHHTMQSAGDIVTLNYTMLRSARKTVLPEAPTRILHFNLTGNMNRYQWSINNKTISETDVIKIKKGENIRIIMTNESMMRHPMHFHGHEFRVLNRQGDYAPLKNVLDIMPMETDTLEFAAQYDGDWFFHCHLLYHMMSGMGRIFRYENSQPNVQVDTIKNAWKKFLKDDRMWHFSASIAAQSQGVFAKAMVMDRHYIFETIGETDYDGNFESETKLGRYFGKLQYLKLFIGFDIRQLEGIHEHEDIVMEEEVLKRTVATFGVQYLLPMFIQTDLRIDHTGHVRFQVSRHDLALTSRLRFEGMWNTDEEYELGLRYIVTKRFSVSGSYSSHFGAGGGITFTY